MAKLRFLVADDHDIVRTGVRTLLEKQAGWEVVAEASNGREAVEKAKLSWPDVTVLDVMMSELSGLEAAREILKSIPTKILILTGFDSEELIEQAIEVGVKGYLLKSDAVRDLVSAAEAVSQDKTFFAPKVAQIALEAYLGRPTRKRELRLTVRQKQILKLLAEGKSSRQIAATLNISVSTAETHRTNILQRLGCHSVAQLVRYAIRKHIIEP